MSQTKHDIIVQFSEIGLNAINGSMKTFSTTSGVATKSQDALGGALGQTQGAAIKLRSDIDKGEKSTSKANTTTGKFSQSQDKAAGSTKSFAEKFQGNRGLIFSVTGIITAGVEAIGMFQNFQNALAKQAAAQDQINKLEAEGITTGREYTQAQRDLDDANRSVTFALRIMALSMGDLIPFSLLLVNQFVNMRAAAQQAAAAKQTLTATTQALGTASQQAATGGLAQMLTSTGQVTTAANAMTPAVRNTSVATNELFTSSGRLVTGFTPMGRAIQDNTNFIGTRNSGLVGGMNALNLGMANTQQQSTKFGTSFTKLGTVFTNIGSSVKTFAVNAAASIGGFFTNMSTNIKGTDGLLNKFKVGFGSFAGAISTGGKGISGAFKAMGLAALAFGRALVSALLSNPITGILIAIGVAVSALIFDFGGFRTAINNVGVAIGNAIPFLKGALTWIGEVGNAALDSVAGFLGFETSAQKAAKAADALRTASLDPLIISLEKYLDLGDQFQNLNTIVDQFAAVRTEIMKLTDVVKVGMPTWVDNWNGVNAATTTALDNIKVRTPQVQQAIDNLTNTMKFLEQNNISAADSSRILTALWNQLIKVAGEDVKETQKAEKAKQELEQQIKLNTQTTDLNALSLRQLIAAQREQEKAGKGSGVAMAENTKIVQDYTTAVGLNVEENQELTNSLLDNAEIIALVGNENVKIKGTTLDVAASIDTWRIANRTLEAQANQTYNLIIDLLEQGKITMEEAVAIVEAAKKTDKEHGAILEEKFKNWQDHIELTQENLSDLIDKAIMEKDVTVDAKQKMMEEEAKHRASLIEEAAKYGLLTDAQDLNVDSLEVAVKAESESQKKQKETIAILQRLALERGLDTKLIQQGTEKNLEFIKSHQLAVPTIDEVRAATGQLIAARQEEIKTTELDRQAAEDYAKWLNIGIDTTGLSAKGILALADVRLEERNATQLATDDVALWSAQLTRNQAVEEETIKQLLEYARVHGIVIPDEVERSSSAIKDFIENGLEEVGPAADDAAKDLVSAFDEMRDGITGFTDSVISDLEKALSEGFDDFEDALDDLGYSLDSLAARQTIINVSLNSQEAEDDILSLTEYIGHAILEIEGDINDVDFRSAAANWRTDIEDELDDVPESVKMIWDQVLMFADQYGGDTGTDYAAALVAAISAATGKLPGEISQILGVNLPDETIAALQGKANDFFGAGKTSIGEPLAKGGVAGLESGQQLFFDASGNLVAQVGEGAIDGSNRYLPSASNTILSQLMSGFNTSSLPQEAGTQVVEDVANSAVDGSGRVMPEASNKILGQLMNGFNQSPLPKQAGEKMGTDTTTGVETGVASMPGIFNQAFVDASILSGTTLAIIIQTVQTTMSNMSTSVATYSNSMKVNFTTALNEMILALPPLNDAVVLAQQTMSTLSTSVSTYANSMMTRITTFTTQAITDLGLWDTAMGTSQQTASTLSTSVATYTNSMKTNINSFATSADKDLGTVETATVDLRDEASSLSSSIATYMSSMSSRVSSFASSAVSNFGKVGSAASKAASDVKQLQSAINSLKDKTVTITVRYKTVGSPGGAQHGGSFIIDKPDRVAGVRVAETFPELATITPLDPKEPNSPFHNVDADLNLPNTTPQTPSLEGLMSTGARGSGGSNVTVTGNLIATIQLPNGEAMAKVVKPYMLKGYSGIVS